MTERSARRVQFGITHNCQEHEMNASVKLSQQDEDTRKQSELTRSVGVRLTRPEKSTSSRWSAIKRLVRVKLSPHPSS